MVATEQIHLASVQTVAVGVVEEQDQTVLTLALREAPVALASRHQLQVSR